MPIAPHLEDDPLYWHKRAEQARVLAEALSDEIAKTTMLRVAEDCDKLAAIARRITNATKSR